ncbi:MAG: hypothetical protein ACTIKR_15100 [Advenella sp.]|uniref:hypothetical protein n=1 Tax=unclassified Advenella TaxID=2685285 RepID=UPI00186717D5|nr:hypothetical protein [Advenella sp. FME57]
MNVELSFDRDVLRNQIDIYKRLKRNGYLESAQKELESIEHQLALVQQSYPDQYEELKAELAL